MEEKTEQPLILLNGVLEDAAAADFARAMREDDPVRYARAYAALLETDAFATVSEFDTDAIAVALGSLTSQVSRPMLQSLGNLVR